MARGKKTGGKDWKPGQSGNPKGWFGYGKDYREAKKLTTAIFNQLGTDLLYAKVEDLQKIIKDPDASMLEKIVAGIIGKAATEQDQIRAAFLLDRILGKPKLNEDQPQIKPVIITTRDGT